MNRRLVINRQGSGIMAQQNRIRHARVTGTIRDLESKRIIANNVFDIEPKLWNYIYFPGLDYKSLLNLLITSKTLYKRRSYIYRLIYIKLVNEEIQHETWPFYYGDFGLININFYKTNIDGLRNITGLFLRNKVLYRMLTNHGTMVSESFGKYKKLFMEYFVKNECVCLTCRDGRIKCNPENIDYFINTLCVRFNRIKLNFII